MPARYTGPNPSTTSVGKIRTSDLKSKILHLSQTSIYQVKIQPPSAVSSFLRSSGRGFNYSQHGENVELMCAEASLPGSSFATHDVTNDYAGVTEKMAYRRIYDETFDVTFYVDYSYNVIEYFDGWIDFMSGIDQGGRTRNVYKSAWANYRMNYPDTYKTNIYLTKFEKDAGGYNEGLPPGRRQTEYGSHPRSQLNYTFVEAFPITASAMPLSYGGTDILRCSISFSYMRYVREREFSSPPGGTGSTPATNSWLDSVDQGVMGNFLDRRGRPIGNSFTTA